MLLHLVQQLGDRQRPLLAHSLADLWGRRWNLGFRDLAVEPVDLRVPDGAHYLWVDSASGKLSAENCPGAVQLPYVDGSEPRDTTACGATAQEQDKESLWKKWFGRDDQ